MSSKSFLIMLATIVTFTGCSTKDIAFRERVYALTLGDAPEKVNVEKKEIVKVSAPTYGKELVAHAMIYKKDGEINRFAYSKWADSPAGMFEKIFIKSLENSNMFSAVLNSESKAKSKYLFEGEIVSFYQEFTGEKSSVVLEVKINLVKNDDFELIASKRLKYIESCDDETPQSGVKAYERALKKFSSDIKSFLISSL